MIPRHVVPALALLFAPLLASSPTLAQEIYDSGRFIVFEHGVPVAHEDFSYQVFTDSIVIRAQTTRKLRGSDGQIVTFGKNMAMIADGFDFGLKRYVSNQNVLGEFDVNGYLAPEEDDTAFTAYQERSGHGEASRLTHPPGHMFIVDSQLFTLFDVIARVLGRQTFDERPVSVLSYGRQPEVLEATARSMPPDTLTWLGNPLFARRIELSDEGTRFELSIAPAGYLLRLVQPEAGLEVLREQPSPDSGEKPPAGKSP